MNRRTFIAQAGAALGGAAVASVVPAWAQTASDVKLEIAPLALEIAPGKVIHTVAYNGQRSGSADSLARRQAHRHRRIQSNRDPRNRPLARPLDALRRWMARRRKAAR